MAPNLDKQFHLDLARAYLDGPRSDLDTIAIRSSYRALRREIVAQFDRIIERGFTVQTGPDCYAGRSEDLFKDLETNRRLCVYNEDDVNIGHPLSLIIWTPMLGWTTHNVLFRAVHDFYGHWFDDMAHHYSFGPTGEENAFQRHARMFSLEARLALVNETRAQSAVNLWLNDVRKGTAPYAEQCCIVLPSRFLSIEEDRPATIGAYIGNI